MVRTYMYMLSAQCYPRECSGVAAGRKPPNDVWTGCCMRKNKLRDITTWPLNNKQTVCMNEVQTPARKRTAEPGTSDVRREKDRGRGVGIDGTGGHLITPFLRLVVIGVQKSCRCRKQAESRGRTKVE